MSGSGNNIEAELPLIEIETASEVTASVIWLHGLGASGDDFAPVVPELNFPPTMGVRFVFPQAPSIPVTINSGYVMPAWYDILSVDIERELDKTQFMASVGLVQNLISREMTRGIPAEKIAVIGFSQGGAVAYQSVLGGELPLAGLVAMSTYIGHLDWLPEEVMKSHTNLPVLIMHGSMDSVVPESLALKAQSALSAVGLSPELKIYSMEHTVCPAQIQDLSQWLQRCLA